MNFYNKTRELCEKIFSHIGVMKASLEKKASAAIVPDMLCILSFLLIRQLYIQTHENVIYIFGKRFNLFAFFRKQEQMKPSSNNYSHELSIP